MRRSIFLLAAAIALTPAMALAQSPPETKPPIAPKVDRVDPNSCANPGAQATIGQGGDIEVSKKDGRSLSDQLARSGGVICPPGRVDSEIHAPTPPGGAMPVIPPPGSPGGDQSVQPK